MSQYQPATASGYFGIYFGTRFKFLSFASKQQDLVMMDIKRCKKQLSKKPLFSLGLKRIRYIVSILLLVTL